MLFVLTLLLIGNSPLLALDPIVLDADQACYQVSPHLEFFEDPDGIQELSGIIKVNAGWKKSKRLVPNFGYTDSTYWFRFSLRNSSEKPLMRYFEIAYPLLEKLELYVPTGDGDFTSYATGTLSSIESRNIIDRNFVFHLAVPTGQTDFYIKIKTDSSLELPVYLWSESGFIKRCNRQLPLLWGYFGMLIMTMLYYFFLFMTEDKENHFYCSVFILSIALCSFYFTGFGFQYVLENASWLNKRFGYYLVYCVVVSGVLYARSNFRQFDNIQWFGRYICRGILWGWFLFMVAGTIGGFGKDIQVLIVIWGLLSISVLVIAIIYCSFSTLIPNYTMLFGTMCYVLGVLAYMFKSLGLLPSNIITSYGHLSGSAVMVLFFAQGAYENILKSQKKLVELSQSRNELERIINQSAATALLLRADKQLSVEFVSENIREFGYLPEDLLSGRNNYIEMVHPEDREMFMDAIQTIFSENIQKSFSLEYRVLSKDNTVFWVDDRKWLRRDEQGTITHIQCILMNISGRKKLEIELNRFHEVELLLSSVTSNFISLHPEAISEGVEKSLALIGAFVGASRGYTFLVSKDEASIVNTHNWNSIYDETDVQLADNYLIRDIPLLKEVLNDFDSDEHLVAPLILDRNDEHLGVLMDALQIGKFNAEIVTPLLSEGRLVGFFGFSLAGNWEEGYAPLLNNVAQILSNVFVRIRYDEDIKEYQAKLRLLSSELVLAEEKERRKIAIEIHDRIGHALANCRMKLGRLQSEVEQLAELNIVSEIRGLIEQSIEDTQTLTFSISPHILYDVGLEAAVDWLAEQAETDHGINFEFIDDMADKPLSTSSGVLLYQIVRELVFNVVKHSNADKSRITINKVEGNIVITIQDNGVGFKTEETLSDTVNQWYSRGKKFGLFSVRERLRNVNGELKIFSEKGKGCRITIVHPLLEENV